jgi:DNA-binding MarR family transcriptional regulator
MQGILVNLEREGLIVRTPHPEHGRVIMTELTEAGQKAVAAGTRAADVVERQMLSALSAKEAKLLRDMLKRCAAALEDEPSRT